MSVLLCSKLATGCIRCPAVSRSIVQPQPAARQLMARPAVRSTRSVRVLAQGDDSHAGHAMLHDFCMTIPYGAVALLSGLVAFIFKATAVGTQLAGAGAVISLCSVLSLKTWKTGGGSAPYTLVSGSVAGWIAYEMWQRVANSIAPVPSGILLALSAALSAFCLYNIVAGGNPPPARKAA